MNTLLLLAGLILTADRPAPVPRPPQAPPVREEPVEPAPPVPPVEPDGGTLTITYAEVLSRASSGEIFMLAVRTSEPAPKPLGYHTAGPFSCVDAPYGVAPGWYWCTRDSAGNAQWQRLSGKPASPAREVSAASPKGQASGITLGTTVPPAAGLSTSWNGATLTAPIPIVVPWTVQRGSTTNCPASG